jgi:hypothetical protein
MKIGLKYHYKMLKINIKCHHPEAYIAIGNTSNPHWKICYKNASAIVILWSEHMLPFDP